VLPETFDFLLGTVNVWIPTDFESRREIRDSDRLRVVGKLREGVTRQQANEQLNVIATRLEQQHPETNRNLGVRLESMYEEFPGETDTRLIQALMLVALAALLIACFNVAGLYLAKTDLRAREIAVRMAMGASKARLLRLLLTESVLLALAAGSLGVVLAVFAIRGMSGALPPEIPSMYTPRMDSGVVAFAVMISALAGVIFGISPALQVLRGDKGRSMLLETSRGGSATRARKRLRAALVAGEFALALAILMSAGVMTSVFEGWVNGDAGFRREGLLTAQITLPEYRYGGDEERSAFLRELGVELDAIGGSTGWAATTNLPRSRGWSRIPVVVEGSGIEPDDAPRSSVSSVTPSFFEVMEIGAVRGRLLQYGDRADTVPVAVVNERFREIVFGGDDPVGERVVFQDETLEIVGVIPNFAQFREQGLMPAMPWIYRSFEQAPTRRVYLALATDADPYALTEPLRSAVWKIDRDQPITAVQSLGEFIDQTLSGPSYVGSLMYQLGFLALALALMGIYGVVAFSVSQQTREIGIRIALGEQTGAVMRGVFRHGAVLAGTGMLIGLPLALGLLRVFGAGMSSLNIDSAMRPIPMIVTALILAAAAIVACYLPARRATQIDPVVALQEE
jgi:putative ABC transport system permease protein